MYEIVLYNQSIQQKFHLILVILRCWLCSILRRTNPCVGSPTLCCCYFLPLQWPKFPEDIVYISHTAITIKATHINSTTTALPENPIANETLTRPQGATFLITLTTHDHLPSMCISPLSVRATSRKNRAYFTSPWIQCVWQWFRFLKNQTLFGYIDPEKIYFI